MKVEVGNKSGSRVTTVRALLRSAGRVVIWVTVALLLAKGAISVLAPPDRRPFAATPAGDPDRVAAAFAARFTRAYLADPSPGALRPLLAEGASLPAGRRPAAGPALVAQAEAVAVHPLGGGRALVTVACELRDSRVLYLAVPIARSRAGEVAATGAPSIVAAPGVAGVDPERPRPIAGAEAAEIGALVEGFLPAYVSSGRPADLEYYLAPGAAARPLGGTMALLGSPGAPMSLDGREGRRRSVAVSARLRDPASGAVYRPTYRLELVKRDRWYVASVRGALR